MPTEPPLTIRPAVPGDLPALREIFAAAKRFMRAHGNLHQWDGPYPEDALLLGQIAQGVCFLVEAAGEPVGTFCCLPSPEPTYAEIDGAWPEDGPYYVIHRLAANGKARGVAAACFGFCAARGLPLRIDTHRDNTVMQALLAKNGFAYCGVIRLADGAERLAYYRGIRRGENKKIRKNK